MLTADTMSLRDLNLRLRALLTTGRVERDLHDELSFHVEREARTLIDAGTPPHAARAPVGATIAEIVRVTDPIE